MQFGISFPHHINQCGDKAVHKRFMHTQEGVAVTYCPSQDTADHVAGLGIRRQLSVGNGKSDGTQVVGNDPHGNIFFGIFAIPSVADLSNLLDDRLKQVGVVVRQLTLYRHTKPLETHPGVDYFCRKRLQRTVRLAVILHEYKVPYFDHLRVALVYKL
ncbi:hypothetical protein SDC9_165115 [bioreactor metagenome]|uniref:Uncharacterized protein n=1 Tax=bioreactor metagenome TaxID=1076179 RepID=A0A645FVN2_9ZZZZ